MFTRIVFDGGGEVTVAQEEADVVHAVRRDHPYPVTLESVTGGPAHQLEPCRVHGGGTRHAPERRSDVRAL
ncbi:MAG: hypothetical protein WA484_00230 [Solirubrobacteraceae bacterium]